MVNLVYSSIGFLASLVLRELVKRNARYYYNTFVYLFTFFSGSATVLVISSILTLLGHSGQSVYVASLIYRHLFSWALGINYTIEGEENLKQSDSVIYVCNHQTLLDVMFVTFVCQPKTSLVTKKELKYVPFFGAFLMFSKTVFLDRNNRSNAVEASKKAVSDVIPSNQKLLIFPEGTRNNGVSQTFLPFKKGAFHMAVQAKVPIVPIVFQNCKHIYNPKVKRFVPGELKIKVLPPISTTDLDSSDVTDLTEKVRNQMIEVYNEMS